MARSGKSLIRFLSEAEVIAINERMVAKYGGLHGVKDLYLLSLAVGRPQMAAALFHSIINNHPFLDGNKRTSLFSAILFLEYNGWNVECRRKEAVKFTRKAHNEDYTVEQISKWLKDHSSKTRR